MRAENNENNAMKFFFNNAVKLIFTYILKASFIKKTSRRLQSRKFPFVVWSRKNVTFVFFLFFLVIKRIYLAKNWGGEAKSPKPLRHRDLYERNVFIFFQNSAYIQILKSLTYLIFQYIQGVSQKKLLKINRNISSNILLLYNKSFENAKCNTRFLKYN